MTIEYHNDNVVIANTKKGRFALMEKGFFYNILEDVKTYNPNFEVYEYDIENNTYKIKGTYMGGKVILI